MIVCWVLFALTSAVGIASYVAVRMHSESFVASKAGDSSISPEVIAEVDRQARLRHRAASPYRELAYISRTAAGGFLLLNIILHTAYWVWMGRKES